MTNECADEDGWFRLGPTTRPVTLTSGETISFAREALDRAVENNETAFLPQIVEHLNYLPPVGRVAEMRVEENAGEAYLLGRTQPLTRQAADDITLPGATDDVAASTAGKGTVVDLAVSIEPRNFDEAVLRTVESGAPVPVVHHAMHSSLPPLIWMLTAGGVGTGVWFAQSFVSAIGDALGRGLVEWLTESGQRARDTDRDQLVEARFDLDSGMTVLAICPFTPESGESVAQLRAGLEALGDVAVYCSTLDDDGVSPKMEQTAFMWDLDRWRLCWWASKDASHITPWFRSNCPDPESFLGRPTYAGMDALEYMLGRGSVSLEGELDLPADTQLQDPDDAGA